VTVAGVGDMSGDVFGNGMLLSQSIHVVAAFDHRHISSIRPPDAATTWAERKRPVRAAALVLGGLQRQADLQGRRHLPAHPEIDPAQPADPGHARHYRQGARSLLADHRDPQGAGRPALLRRHRHLCEGTCAEQRPMPADRANDANRVNGEEVRAKVIGEEAPILALPRPGESNMPPAAGASTPTSSTMRRASTAATMRSTSRSRSTPRWRPAASNSSSATRFSSR